MELHEFKRLVKIVNLFKESELDANSFTKKEFDEIFKGSKITLDWLRENGYRYGYLTAYNTTHFVELVKVEKFEMPYKEPKAQTILWSIDKDCQVNECEINDYRYNKKIRSLIEKIYGQCETRVMTQETFEASKHWYKIHIDELEKAIELEKDKMIKQCQEKLEKAKTEYETMTEVLKMLQEI